MTETQKRIRAYKKALPHLKERVLAVALLFAMSAAMMTSASFAWITLSKAPAVNGLATTVSTNGNLEIALVNPDGTLPDITGINDGSGLIVNKNLKWGNLINLSDSSYGLDKLVLRPASLNINQLLTSPVQAVKYGADGRVNGYITDFAFTNYNPTLQTFAVNNPLRYGVRAVSSVTYENITGNKFIVDQVREIKERYTQATVDFAQLYGNDEYMDVVGKLVQTHANVTLSDTDVDCAAQMPKLMELMDSLQRVVDDIGWLYVEFANLRYYQSLTDVSQYEAFTLQDLLDNEIPSQYTRDFKNFDKYLDYTTPEASNQSVAVRMRKAYTGVAQAAQDAEQGKPVMWQTKLMGIADILCDFDTATIHGYRVDQLIGNETAMFQVFMNQKKCKAVVVEGVLKDIDQFIDGEFYVQNGRVAVNVSYLGITVNATPSVETAAVGPYYLSEEVTRAEEFAAQGGNSRGDAVAAETYAMAIDLWVRTNIADALLVLEGELITEPRQKLNADGTPMTTAKVDENGNIVTDANGDPVMVPVMEDVVVGYRGVNRVWDELDDPNSSASAAISGLGTSITQGSGSCYVFYPQSIDDRNQCLKLLAAMQIVFFDDQGNALAKAYMDTKHPLEEAGRILVPLQLYKNTEAITDANGDTHEYYISSLNRNEAKRITAMVYLDGTNLTNADVLAAGSITGQLNLQFGTTQMEMDAMEDKDLMDDYYSVNVTSNKNFTFAESATSWNYPLQMTIQGIEPASVKANFVSVISATQGARQQTFDILKNPATGFYEANVSFAGPGNYQLRSVQIDGVDYPLKEVVHVTIPGESVTNLRWGDGTMDADKNVLTADAFYQQPISLTLRTGSSATVRAVFVGDNGSNVSVNFTTTNGQDYVGVANFNASGRYTLDYVYINGSPTALDAGLRKSITISLGLRAQVYLAEPYVFDENDASVKIPVSQTSLVSDYTFTPGSGYYFVYTGSEPIFFDVRCKIVNDVDEEIMGMSGVEINYGQGQSLAYALSDELTWDADSGYYVGTFDFQSFGIFEFQNVVVNRVNYVTVATTAHRITSVSTDPMEYVPTQTQDIMFKLGADDSERTLSLVLKYASAAKLDITVTNEKGQSHTFTEVQAASTDLSNNSVFTVAVPDDGRWTITAVRANTVFYKEPGAENGVFYAGGENPENWLDLTTLPNWQTDLSTLFITDVEVTLTTKQERYAFQGEFFEKTHTVAKGDLVLNFTARYDGKPITYYANMTGVTLDASAAGSYIYSSKSNPRLTISRTPDNVAVSASGVLPENGTLALEAIGFLEDGKYACNQLTVTLNGQTYEIYNMPAVEVTWIDPEIKFTAVDPVNTTVQTGGNSTGSATNTFTNYAATCHYKAEKIGVVCTYTAPELTAELSKAGNGYDSATCLVDGTNHDVTFTFKSPSNGVAYSTQDIGVTGGDRPMMGNNAPGREVVLKRGDVTYTFTLVNPLSITLNQ